MVTGNPSSADLEEFLIANVSYYKTVVAKKAMGPAPSNGEWKNATAPSTVLTNFVASNCRGRLAQVVGAKLATDPGKRGALTKTWHFNNEVVYHDTDAGNACTLFFTKSADGKNGRIVGYGFHTDIHNQSKYKLDYIDPAWNVPASIDINANNPKAK